MRPRKLFRQAIELVVELAFLGLFTRERKRAPLDPPVSPYVAKSADLLRRRDAGLLSHEEYEVARREIAEAFPQGHSGDNSRWAYRAIVATIVGLYLAYIAALAWAILTVTGLGRQAPIGWSVIAGLVAAVAGVAVALGLGDKTSGRMSFRALWLIPPCVVALYAGVVWAAR